MSQINQVKEATNIVDLIGSRVTLQRSGSNFKGLCPFHNEKSPSFYVSETMQRYKCFGCGKTGDAFTFLEEYEGMTFRESLETLAQAAGVTLTAAAPNTQEDIEREQLLQILDLARAYYHFLLTEHSVGEEGRQYLKGRGVQQASVRQFQLGYALPAWDGLVTYLHDKKKYDHALIIKAGLATKSASGRIYDRFRSRIMFPLRNHRGQVVGFSGRILNSKVDKETPKYINTPETVLYHKSQMLFGFYENLQNIRKEKKLVVVEGEFDVISSIEAHVPTVVAIKGSALTMDHVKLLSRSVDQIILCLDADNAGIAATKKAIEVVKAGETSRTQPLSLSVLRIPEGKDPDELSQNDQKRWRELVKRPITAYEFLIVASCERNDPHSPHGKSIIMDELKPVLKPLEEKNAVEFEYYTKLLAEKIDTSVASVQKDIRNAAAPVIKNSGDTTKPKEKVMTRQREREQYILFLITNAEPEKRKKWSQELLDISLETTESKPILEAFSTTELPLSEFITTLPDDMQQAVFDFSTNPKYYAMLEKIDLSVEWQNAVKDLKQEQMREAGQKIEAELEALDRIPNKTYEQEEQQKLLLEKLVLMRTKARK
jgi:DNA primase